MDHRPFSEPPRHALDHADLMVEHHGWTEPRDERPHTVLLDRRGGDWWAQCESCCGLVAFGADRDDVIGRARGHCFGSRVVETTPFGRELL